MVITYRSNLWGGIVGILFGVGIWVLVPYGIGRDLDTYTIITSRTMPSVMALVSTVSGLGLVFQSLILKRDTVKRIVVTQEMKALLYMAILAAYGMLFKYGFILSTAGLGVVTLALFKCRRPLFYSIVLATVFALYFIFTRLLFVKLP